MKTILNNSLGHLEENNFLSWLKTNLFLVGEDMTIDNAVTWLNTYKHLSDKEIRDKLLLDNSSLCKDVLLSLYDRLFEDVGERNFKVEVASVGIDGYGPGQSRYNTIYDIMGMYVLMGSDFADGPTEDLNSLLDQLTLNEASDDEQCFHRFINEDYVDFDTLKSVK